MPSGPAALERRSYITHPVAVATILARLDDAGEVDDQTLCAAILHGTVVHTSYTLAAMRRDFGAGIAAMAAGHMALHHLGERPGRQGRQVTAAVASADARGHYETGRTAA